MSPKRRKQRTRPHKTVRYCNDIIETLMCKNFLDKYVVFTHYTVATAKFNLPVMHNTVYNITFFVRHYVRQLCGVRRPPRPERWSVGLRLLLKLQSPAARKLPTSGCSGSSGGCSPLFIPGVKRSPSPLDRSSGSLHGSLVQLFIAEGDGSWTTNGLFLLTCGHGIRAAEGSQAFGLRKETKLSLASRQLAGLQRAELCFGRRAAG